MLVVPQNVVRREMLAAMIARVTKRTELGPYNRLKQGLSERGDLSQRLVDPLEDIGSQVDVGGGEILIDVCRGAAVHHNIPPSGFNDYRWSPSSMGSNFKRMPFTWERTVVGKQDLVNEFNVHSQLEHMMSHANTDQLIKSVQVFSTGSGGQHKEHRYGSRLPRLWWVLTSRSWIEVPTNVYVIEHRDGLVLFDAGLDPAIGTDPNYISSPIGRFFLRKLFHLHIGPDDALTKKLEGLGYSAADVRKVIVSHLHFDHVGCIANVPQAELLVSRDEWRQLSGPHPERDFIFREHIELPSAKWCQIDFAPTSDPLFAPFGGCFDVMGDGSMTLLPTPGHTPGSTSMLVRTDGLPPLLLVGDLTYEVGLLMKDQVPGTGNKRLLRSSFAKVRALKTQLPDLLILPAHDPAATEALRTAAQPIDVETKRKFSSNNGSDSTTRNDGTVL